MRPQPHPPFPPLKVVLLFLFNSFSGLSAHLSYSRTYRVVSCHLEALWTKHVLNMHLLVKGIDNLTRWESAKKGRMGRGIRHRVKKEAVLNGTVRDRGRKGTKATWIRTHELKMKDSETSGLFILLFLLACSLTVIDNW